jgi:hypothetical protein
MPTKPQVFDTLPKTWDAAAAQRAMESNLRRVLDSVAQPAAKPDRRADAPAAPSELGRDWAYGPWFGRGTQ